VIRKLFIFLFCFSFFWDMVSLCSSGWSQTCDPFASASWVLEHRCPPPGLAKKTFFFLSWALWYRPVISALTWQRQEDHKFRTSLGYVARLGRLRCWGLWFKATLKKQIHEIPISTNSWAWWHPSYMRGWDWEGCGSRPAPDRKKKNSKYRRRLK
jgi:hypothetical protein